MAGEVLAVGEQKRHVDAQRHALVALPVDRCGDDHAGRRGARPQRLDLRLQQCGAGLRGRRVAPPLGRVTRTRSPGFTPARPSGSWTHSASEVASSPSPASCRYQPAPDSGSLRRAVTTPSTVTCWPSRGLRASRPCTAPIAATGSCREAGVVQPSSRQEASATGSTRIWKPGMGGSLKERRALSPQPVAHGCAMRQPRARMLAQSATPETTTPPGGGVESVSRAGLLEVGEHPVDRGHDLLVGQGRDCRPWPASRRRRR